MCVLFVCGFSPPGATTGVAPFGSDLLWFDAEHSSSKRDAYRVAVVCSTKFRCTTGSIREGCQKRQVRTSGITTLSAHAKCVRRCLHRSGKGSRTARSNERANCQTFNRHCQRPSRIKRADRARAEVCGFCDGVHVLIELIGGSGKGLPCVL